MDTGDYGDKAYYIAGATEHRSLTNQGPHHIGEAL